MEKYNIFMFYDVSHTNKLPPNFIGRIITAGTVTVLNIELRICCYILDVELDLGSNHPYFCFSDEMLDKC